MNVATTNHFEFSLLAFPTNLLTYVQLREPLITRNFLSREMGLLCKGAELPGATFATAEVKGNYMGISQKYAHTRIYTESSFTFMVDSQYRILKFFQLWQEFIASGGEASLDKRAYYTRMRYPDDYKCSQMQLSKFDRDHFQKIDYTYINAFPINITPTAVDYGTGRVLEISVSFNYDRFVTGDIKSLDYSSDQRKTYNEKILDAYTFKPSGESEYSNIPFGVAANMDVDFGLGADATKFSTNLPPLDWSKGSSQGFFYTE